MGRDIAARSLCREGGEITIMTPVIIPEPNANVLEINLPSNDSISFGFGWKNHCMKVGSFQSGSLNALSPTCGRWTPGL